MKKFILSATRITEAVADLFLLLSLSLVTYVWYTDALGRGWLEHLRAMDWYLVTLPASVGLVAMTVRHIVKKFMK